MRGNVIVQITMSRVNLTLIQHILGVLRKKGASSGQMRCRAVML